MEVEQFQMELIQTLQEESQASIKQLNKATFRFFVIGIVAIVCNVFVTLLFVLYLYQYDFSSTMESVTTTISQDSKDGGDDTYVGGDVNDKTNVKTVKVTKTRVCKPKK